MMALFDLLFKREAVKTPDRITGRLKKEESSNKPNTPNTRFRPTTVSRSPHPYPAKKIIPSEKEIAITPIPVKTTFKTGYRTPTYVRSKTPDSSSEIRRRLFNKRTRNSNVGTPESKYKLPQTTDVKKAEICFRRPLTRAVDSRNITVRRGQTSNKLEGQIHTPEDLSRASSVTNLNVESKVINTKGAKPRKTASRDKIDRIGERKNDRKGITKNNNKLDCDETTFDSLQEIETLKTQLHEMASEKSSLALELGEHKGQINSLQNEIENLKLYQQQSSMQLEQLTDENMVLRNRLRDVAHSPLSDNEKQQILYDSHHRHHNSAPASIATNILEDSNGGDITACPTPEWDKHSSSNVSEVAVACLQDKINQMQETHYSTNEELQATLQELTDLQRQLTELQQENERLLEGKNLMFDSLCRQTERLKDSRQEVESLKQLLYREKNETDVESVVEREQKLVDLLKSAQGEHETLILKHDQVSNDLQELKETNTSQHEQLKQLTERNGTLESTLDAKHAEHKQLDQELAQAKDQSSGRQIEINRLKDLLENARTKINELEQDRTMSDKSELDEMLDNARKEKDSLESEVAHLKEQLARSRNEIEKLKEQVSVLQEECKVIRNNAKSTQSDLEYKCEKLIGEKTALTDQLHNFQEAVNELQVQAQCQAEDKRNLSDVLSETQRNLSESERRIMCLESDLVDFRKLRKDENEEWEKFQNDLLTSVRVANDFKTEAQQDLQRTIMENKAHRDKVRQLEAQLDKLKDSPNDRARMLCHNKPKALRDKGSNKRDLSNSKRFSSLPNLDEVGGSTESLNAVKRRNKKQLKTRRYEKELSKGESKILTELDKLYRSINPNTPEEQLTAEEKVVRKLKSLYEEETVVYKPVAPRNKDQLAISKPLLDSVYQNPRLQEISKNPHFKSVEASGYSSVDYKKFVAIRRNDHEDVIFEPQSARSTGPPPLQFKMLPKSKSFDDTSEEAPKPQIHKEDLTKLDTGYYSDSETCLDQQLRPHNSSEVALKKPSSLKGNSAQRSHNKRVSFGEEQISELLPDGTINYGVKLELARRSTPNFDTLQEICDRIDPNVAEADLSKEERFALRLKRSLESFGRKPSLKKRMMIRKEKIVITVPTKESVENNLQLMSILGNSVYKSVPRRPSNSNEIPEAVTTDNLNLASVPGAVDREHVHSSNIGEKENFVELRVTKKVLPIETFAETTRVILSEDLLEDDLHQKRNENRVKDYEPVMYFDDEDGNSSVNRRSSRSTNPEAKASFEEWKSKYYETKYEAPIEYFARLTSSRSFDDVYASSRSNASDINSGRRYSSYGMRILENLDEYLDNVQRTDAPFEESHGEVRDEQLKNYEEDQSNDTVAINTDDSRISDVHCPDENVHVGIVLSDENTSSNYTFDETRPFNQERFATTELRASEEIAHAEILILDETHSVDQEEFATIEVHDPEEIIHADILTSDVNTSTNYALDETDSLDQEEFAITEFRNQEGIVHAEILASDVNMATDYSSYDECYQYLSEEEKEEVSQRARVASKNAYKRVVQEIKDIFHIQDEESSSSSEDDETRNYATGVGTGDFMSSFFKPPSFDKPISPDVVEENIVLPPPVTMFGNEKFVINSIDSKVQNVTTKSHNETAFSTASEHLLSEEEEEDSICGDVSQYHQAIDEICDTDSPMSPVVISGHESDHLTEDDFELIKTALLEHRRSSIEQVSERLVTETFHEMGESLADDRNDYDSMPEQQDTEENYIRIVNNGLSFTNIEDHIHSTSLNEEFEFIRTVRSKYRDDFKLIDSLGYIVTEPDEGVPGNDDDYRNSNASNLSSNGVFIEEIPYSQDCDVEEISYVNSGKGLKGSRPNSLSIIMETIPDVAEDEDENEAAGGNIDCEFDQDESKNVSLGLSYSNEENNTSKIDSAISGSCRSSIVTCSDDPETVEGVLSETDMDLVKAIVSDFLESERKYSEETNETGIVERVTQSITTETKTIPTVSVYSTKEVAIADHGGSCRSSSVTYVETVGTERPFLDVSVEDVDVLEVMKKHAERVTLETEYIPIDSVPSTEEIAMPEIIEDNATSGRPDASLLVNDSTSFERILTKAEIDLVNTVTNKRLSRPLSNINIDDLDFLELMKAKYLKEADVADPNDDVVIRKKESNRDSVGSSSSKYSYNSGVIGNIETINNRNSFTREHRRRNEEIGERGSTSTKYSLELDRSSLDLYSYEPVYANFKELHSRHIKSYGDVNKKPKPTPRSFQEIRNSFEETTDKHIAPNVAKVVVDTDHGDRRVVLGANVKLTRDISENVAYKNSFSQNYSYTMNQAENNLENETNIDKINHSTSESNVKVIISQSNLASGVPTVFGRGGRFYDSPAIETSVVLTENNVHSIVEPMGSTSHEQHVKKTKKFFNSKSALVENEDDFENQACAIGFTINKMSIVSSDEKIAGQLLGNRTSDEMFEYLEDDSKTNLFDLEVSSLDDSCQELYQEPIVDPKNGRAKNATYRFSYYADSSDESENATSRPTSREKVTQLKDKFENLELNRRSKSSNNLQVKKSRVKKSSGITEASASRCDSATTLPITLVSDNRAFDKLENVERKQSVTFEFGSEQSTSSSSRDYRLPCTRELDAGVVDGRDSSSGNLNDFDLKTSLPCVDFTRVDEVTKRLSDHNG